VAKLAAEFRAGDEQLREPTCRLPRPADIEIAFDRNKGGAPSICLSAAG